MLGVNDLIMFMKHFWNNGDGECIINKTLFDIKLFNLTWRWVSEKF